MTFSTFRYLFCFCFANLLDVMNFLFKSDKVNFKLARSFVFLVFTLSLLNPLLVGAQVLDKKTLYKKLERIDSLSKTKDTLLLKKAIRSLAVFYTEQGNYAKSIETYYRFLALYPENALDFDFAVAEYNLAVNFFYSEKLDEALSYGKKALSKFYALDKSTKKNTASLEEMLGETFNVLAGIYNVRRELDSANHYFDKAERVIIKQNDIPALANLRMNKGLLMADRGKSDSSKLLLQNAKDLFLTAGDSSGVSKSYYNLCQTIFNTRKESISGSLLNLCLAYLDSAERFTPKYAAAENLLGIYNFRYVIFNESKQYEKALLYYSKYSAIEDSLANQEKINFIENAKINYELENEAQKNKTLATENQLLKSETENKNLLLIVSLTLALLLITLVFVFFFRNKIKLERKQRETETKALNLQMNPHFVFNALNSAQAYILQNKKEEAHEYLSDISKTVRHFLNYNNLKTTNLHDEMEILKLYISIEEKRIKSKINLVITNQTEFELSELTLPPALLQPIIENSIWHGFKDLSGDKEKNIHVTVNENGKNLLINLTDNGSGFVTEKSAHQSKGLSIIRERLFLYSNKQDALMVKELPNKTGVSVTLKLPLILKT